MIGKEQAADRLQKALEISGADETEIVLMVNDMALTRFANNEIHQNVAETNAVMVIKAADGRRIGSAASNDLSDEGIGKVARRALLHAQQIPEDPDYAGLPEPQEVPFVDAYDKETGSYSPEARARAVGTISTMASEKGLKAFGAYRTAAREVAVANSRGLFAYHPSTVADLLATISGDAGSGRAQASSWKAPEIDAEAVGLEAIDKALRAQDPQPIDPAPYPVVLDPYAVQDLIQMLAYTGISAQTVQEGQSWMNGRIGELVMSPLVTIWDDGQDPGGVPMPFDFEGVPKKRIKIVEEGWIREPVYDHYTAHKEGKESTGHATPPNMAFIDGPMPANMFMAPGNSSIEEMIKSVDKGLYITRFWYTRPVHPRDCVVTGMTRDGVYLIEDGVLTNPVKDLRFTQSYVDAMAQVSAVSRNRRTLISEYGGTECVPAVKIDSFNFTGITV